MNERFCKSGFPACKSMKYTIITVLIIALLVGVGFYLFSNKKNTNIPVVEQGSDLPTETSSDRFVIDTTKSNINWYGEMAGIRSHRGTIKLSRGEGTIEDDVVTGGSFTINMTTIKENDGSERLETHLKSDDFFSVETYPEAVFEITSISKAPIAPADYTIKGNLTIKGKTNEITFPAKIARQQDNTFIATGDVEIDRSLWDVRYGSDSFFDNLGDQVISNTIKLNLFLVTNPVALPQI